MIALILALQLAAAPCPPSLACTVPPLAATRTASGVTATADPGRPAEWFAAAYVAELAAFELWALETDPNTVSHAAQRASRAHPVVRWSIVGGGALLIWHLAWGLP